MIDKMLTCNSPPAIQQRIQAGRIGWAGPLVLTTARTGLILLVQAVVATAFLIHRDSSPWRAQAPWWTVYATLVDIGCLLLLSLQARREGIRLADLFGIDRRRIGREILWGVLYFVVLFPIVAGFGSRFASWLAYGTTQLTPHMLRQASCPNGNFRSGRSSTACRSFGWFGPRPKKSSTRPIVRLACKS